MKKRDLYFSLHVERVRIASPQSKSVDAEPQTPQLQEQKAVARVTLTNWENEFVVDTFVAIPVPVSDFYETGIRPGDVQSKSNPSLAPSATDESPEAIEAADTADGSSCSFGAVRAKVERILRGKILIGNELDEGLQALGLSHPKTDMRDCSVYFCKKGANVTTPSSLLEDLSEKELKRPFKFAKAEIAKDSPENNDVMHLAKDSSVSRRPVQICVTTMELYKKHRSLWETALITETRERERQQQNYLLKISQQRQQEQHQAQQQVQQQVQQQAQQQSQQRVQQRGQQHVQQQQFREIATPISLHCETVRTASGRATLARVIIVDGPSRNVLLDDFAQIPVPVKDFCETGITEKDVRVGNCSNGKKSDAPVSNFPKPLSILRSHVERLLRGRLLVGYKVEESLKALGLTHPWNQVRDIAYFQPFLHTKVVGGSTSVATVRSLDELSGEFLRQQLRPLGDRFRPLDICQSSLGLYERFRDQWDIQPHGQHQEVFNRRLNQHQQVHHPHHLQGRMIPPSPSTMLQSPHMRQNQYYGQQSRAAPYSPQVMMTPPPQQQSQRQRLMPEQQQQQYSNVQSRSSSNSSSWFPWGKQQQPQHQNNIVGASQTLSPQAFQVLQEDSCEQVSPAPPKYNFFPVDSPGGSAFAERRSSYNGSAYGGCSQFSGVTSEAFGTDSVASSMRDDTSSIISGDQASANPPVQECESSSLPSSWFRFGSKRIQSPTNDDTKGNCDTMAAVQETEVFIDDGMLPLPTTLFPASDAGDTEDDMPKSLQKTTNVEGKEDESALNSSMSPVMPRSWFGFRKSPVQKDRSESPSISISETTFEDLSISAQPEGLPDTATEASIEITLSIPASVESDDTLSSLVDKAATTSLSCRPSSSWFGFRRSSKSFGSKNSNLNTNSFGKGSVHSEMPYHPDLLPAPTELTTAMDDDWLQEFMSQSTRTNEELEPWMNGTGQANSQEISEKPLSTSRGQATWFGFKRSKASSSNKASQLITSLDATLETFKEGSPNDDDKWSDGAATDGFWLPEEANASVPADIGHNDNEDMNDIFHTRARLPTESTIPSVATDEPSEDEHSQSGSYTKDLDFGAAQSFNFLKI